MKLMLRCRKMLLSRVTKACIVFSLFLLPAYYAVAQKPGGIGVPAGLTSWFKANGGNVAATPASGNRVSLWVSELGNITLSQTTVNQQPFLLPSNDSIKFNFNPFVRFVNASATGLRAITTTPNLLGTAGTVFLITNKANTSTAFTYSVNGSYRWQVKPGFRAQVGLNGFGWTGDFVAGVVPSTSSDSAAFITTTKSNGASFRARKNGDSLALTNTNNTTYNPAILTSGLHVGWNGSSEIFNGGIAEIITYNVTLTDTAINKVESYLALKYGITLSQNSAYGSLGSSYRAADGTIFWNSTANAGYGNCITGIGNDDSSGLAQKQSRSVHNNWLVSIYNGSAGGTFPVDNLSNASVIAADKSFLVAGDNGLSKALSICLANGSVTRMARTWKVQKTGTGISTATIVVAKDSVPANVTRLVVSSDPTFLTAAVYYPLTLTNGKLYASVNFNNNEYFSFATDSLQVALTPSSPSCANPTSGGITVVTTGGNPAYTYLWTPSGQTTANLSNVAAGTYTVAVIKGACQTTASATITALVPIATPVISSSNITVNSISFSWLPITGATGYQVSIDGGTYTVPSSGNTGTTHIVTGLKPLQTVGISVIALGAQICQNSLAGNGTAKTLSDVIFIPNVFTPNADGSNDLFKAYGNSITGIAMKIFDQWGELLFEGTDMQKGWDGAYKGKQQPVGVYIYTIKIRLLDGTEVIKKGSVNLVR